MEELQTIEVKGKHRLQALSTYAKALVTPQFLLLVVLVIAASLRIYRFDALGLWIDEGYTVMFARMSWADVLGLHGAYDPSPPLYFALAKLSALVFPELIAGRLVSVVVRVLTIPVLYALARRLSNAWIALSACAVLAVSPLHIWYSQEARQYVLTMLFVAISYWALVAYCQAPAKKWAAIYGISVLLAMYANYSALYALLLQPLIIVACIRAQKQKRAALPLLVALAAAVAAYLPWVPAWLTAIADADPFRATYLGVSTDRVVIQTLSLFGLAGNGQYFAGTELLPWEGWPDFRWLMLLALAPALIAGSIALARRYRFAFAISLILLVGTLAAAILLSLVSPGFALRTIIYALLGWAMLVGAAAFRDKLPVWAYGVGLVSFCAVLAFSLISLVAIYRGADKQRWQEVAADVARIVQLGKPVLLVRPLNYTLIDVYRPGILAGHTITDTEALKALNPSNSDAVWFAYHDTPRFDSYHQQLNALGYERIMHKYYYNPLYLDLYIKPDAHLGEKMPINGQFVTSGNTVESWQLPAQGSLIKQGAPSGNELVLSSVVTATASLPAISQGLYTLEVGARSSQQSGVSQALAAIVCVSTTGDALYTTSPDTASPAAVSNDNQWHTLRIAALCPENTSAVKIELWNAGVGKASFRDVQVYAAATPGK